MKKSPITKQSNLIEKKLMDILSKKDTIAVFGVGVSVTRAERILRKINRCIDFLVDNDYKLHGTEKHGYPIKDFNYVQECDKNSIAIIVNNDKEKLSHLNTLNLIKNYNYFIFDDLIYPSIAYSDYYRSDVHAPWYADAEFISTYAKMRKNTLVDITRCYELVSLIKQTQFLEGDVLEVGVWRGGSGFLLAHYASQFDKTVYLADTFEGVVKTDVDKDLTYFDGLHNDTSLETVKELFDYYDYNNYVLLKGIFPDETASVIKDRLIAFCHIDVDVYESARLITEWVWERMPIGGIIVYDDYGFSDCNGVTDYVNKFASDCSDKILIYNLNGHGIIIKTK